MTLLERDIIARSGAINRLGYLMTGGLIDITAENESLVQTGMTAMLVVNENNLRLQESIKKGEI